MQQKQYTHTTPFDHTTLACHCDFSIKHFHSKYSLIRNIVLKDIQVKFHYNYIFFVFQDMKHLEFKNINKIHNYVPNNFQLKYIGTLQPIKYKYQLNYIGTIRDTDG